MDNSGTNTSQPVTSNAPTSAVSHPVEQGHVPTPVSNQQSTHPAPPAAVVSESPTQKNKDSKKTLPILLLLLVVVALGIGGYFYLQNQKPTVQLTIPATTQPTSPTPDPMVDWKVYSSNDAVLSFKYPKEWEIETIENFSFPIVLKDKPETQFYIIQIHLLKNTNVDTAVETDTAINSAENIMRNDTDIFIGEKSAVEVKGDYKNNDKYTKGFKVSFIQLDKDVVKIVLNDSSYLNIYNQILSTLRFDSGL